MARNWVLALLMGLLISQAYAHEYSLVGVAQMSGMTASNLPAGMTDFPISSRLGVGAGVLVSGSLGKSDAELEFGLLYLNPRFHDDTNSITYSLKVIQVPIVLRYWVIPVLSIGGGMFWETGVGTVAMTDSSGKSSTSSYYDAGFSKKNIGVLGDVGVRIPLGSSVAFMADGRYLKGLSNVRDSASKSFTLHTHDIQVLAGLTFYVDRSR